MRPSKIEKNPKVLGDAAMRRVHRRIRASGNLTLPAVPSLLESHVDLLKTHFEALGRIFEKDASNHLRRILSDKIAEGWRHSPHCHLLIDWQTEEPPAVAVSYNVSVRFTTLTENFDGWLSTRKPPLFGAHPDCRVMEVARSLGTPAETRCLDVGAGTGRNTFALARAGFQVDALEPVPSFVQQLKKEATELGVNLGVIQADVLVESLALKPAHYHLVFISEVISNFRNEAELRLLFERASRALVPGGMMLFNVFLPEKGYTPPSLIRELSEIFWTATFTTQEISRALDGLGFEPLADDLVYAYEKAALPETAWPPTGWFPDWSRGLDIFDLKDGDASPIQLHWLLYRKT
jgi:SAM-dependent methyltransferase